MSILDTTSNENHDTILEKIFDYIQKGNDEEDRNELWKASFNFDSARCLLDQLVILVQQQQQQQQQQNQKQQQQQQQNQESVTIDSMKKNDNNNNNTDDENIKIIHLYQEKSMEYFHRSRQCFIRAIKNENELDEKKKFQSNDTIMKEIKSNHHHPPITTTITTTIAPTTTTTTLQSYYSYYHYNTLSDDVYKDRLSLFGRLFAKDPSDGSLVFGNNKNNNNYNNNKNKNNSMEDEEQAQELENRLKELNNSLPSKLKSEDERMRGIHQGLRRLGLSLYSASDPRSNKPLGGVFQIDKTKSDIEQVADLIAQVQDEINVTTESSSVTIPTTITDAGESSSGLINAVKTQVNNSKKNLSGTTMAQLWDALNDEDGSDIENELDEDDEPELTPVVCKNIQDKLAEAQAALAELIAMFDVDSSGDAPIHFDQGSGKHALKKARLQLLQVTKTWENC